MAHSRQRWAVATLTIIVAVLGLLLWWWTRPDAERAIAEPSDPARTGAAGAAGASAAGGRPEAAPTLDDPATLTSEPPSMAGGQPFWRPGLPHWYGPREDPFIRQPHDYPPTTPEKLGAAGVYLFDLEHVQDMVRRGQDGDSEIAVALGHPISDEQREGARGVIQTFFDQTVPDIDAVLSDKMTPDQAFARIAPRRQKMDGDLRLALGLSQAQFAHLWPQAVEQRH